LHCAAELSTGATSADVLPFVHAAAIVLVQKRDLVLTIGACKAIVSFCPRLPPADLAPYMPGILTGIASMLAGAAQSSSEDVLELLLATLAIAVGVSPEAVAIYEPSITAALLQVWAAKPNDGLLADDVMDVFKRIMAHQQCISGLQERLLPTLSVVIADDSDRFSGLVLSSIDLLQSFVLSSVQQTQKQHQHHQQQQGGPTQATPAAAASAATSIVQFRQALTSLLKFMLTAASDHEALELGCTCLRAFVFKFGNRIVEWGAAQGLMDVIARLLDPAVANEARAADIAPLVGEVIAKFSGQLGSSLEPLLQHVLWRLVAAKESGTVMPLVNVFALVAIDHAQWLIEFLARANDQALPFVMSRWISHHPDLHGCGHYQVKQSAIALTKILLLRDKRVEETMIEIKEVDEDADKEESTDGTKKAEATATTAPQKVPLPVAILQVLCREYKSADWESSMESAVVSAEASPQKKRQHHHSAIVEGLVQGNSGGEDDDDDDIEDAVIEKLKGAGALFAAAEDYAGIINAGKVATEGEDGDDEYGEEEAEDKDIVFIQGNPIFRTDLKHFLEQAVRDATDHTEFLKALYWRLSAEERVLFDVLWARAKGRR
jgi:hypothetical protein